jgi:hypothetical protein
VAVFFILLQGFFWELTKTRAQVHPLHREAMAPKAELKRWCPIREDTEDYLKKIFEEVRSFGTNCAILALFRHGIAAISTSKLARSKPPASLVATARKC